MRLRVLRVTAAALLLQTAVAAQDLPQTRGLHPLQLEVPGAAPVLYAVSVADGYRSSMPAPLVVVLHPGGQRIRYYGADFMRRVGRQPTYAIHSREDEVVPFEPAEEIARDLKKLKRDVEFEALDDFTHFDMTSYIDALQRAGRWVAGRWN